MRSRSTARWLVPLKVQEPVIESSSTHRPVKWLIPRQIARFARRLRHRGGDEQDLAAFRAGFGHEDVLDHDRLMEAFWSEDA